MNKEIKLAVAVGVLIGGCIGVASAQVFTSDRNKAGDELERTLAGTDNWIATIRHHFDGGTAEAVCGTLPGFGYHVMCYPDGRGYVAADKDGLSWDGGALGVTEMVPLGAYEKYDLGLLGVNVNKVCVRQDKVQDDAGSVVLMHCFRRF